MLEKQIEVAVKEYARGKGWLAYKFVSPGHVGVCDCLLISPNGFVMFMEFKQKGKKATPIQLREIDRVNQHGVYALLVDSVEQGKAIINAHS